MRSLNLSTFPLLALLFAFLPTLLWSADMERFAGTYIGNAEFMEDGKVQQRDMSTTIEPSRDGFVLSWTSVTYRSDGRTKQQTYMIEFVPSYRDNIFQSAMKANLFGKAAPLDPMKGEPYVWARLDGDTISVYSLFIDEDGAYEIQEFNRTLVAGGLDLFFRRVRGGTTVREIRTLLERQP